jgi:hypothetical protein
MEYQKRRQLNSAFAIDSPAKSLFGTLKPLEMCEKQPEDVLDMVARNIWVFRR